MHYVVYMALGQLEQRQLEDDNWKNGHLEEWTNGRMDIWKNGQNWLVQNKCTTNYKGNRCTTL